MLYLTVRFTIYFPNLILKFCIIVIFAKSKSFLVLRMSKEEGVYKWEIDRKYLLQTERKNTILKEN